MPRLAEVLRLEDTRRASRWRWGCWCGLARTSGEIPTPTAAPGPSAAGRAEASREPWHIRPCVSCLLGEGGRRRACLTAVSSAETRALLIRFPPSCRRRRCRRRHQGSQTNKQSQKPGQGGRAMAARPAGRAGPSGELRGGLGTRGARAHTHWDSGRGRSGPDGLFPL